MEDLEIFSSSEARNKTLKYLAVGLAFFVLLVIALGPYRELLTDAEALRSFVRGFGVLGPLVLIVIQVLQVLAAPIPGHVVGAGAGYAFGIFWGTFYAWIGLTLGSAGAILLSHHYGRPFVENVIEEETLDRFDSLIDRHGFKTFFLLFLMPGFPDDSICFIAGLTNLDVRKMILMSAVGRIPGLLSLTVIGDSLAVGNMMLMALMIVVVTAWSLGALYYSDYIVETG
ncbi:MAG: TVP38/TMEM64 family protein [Candidatus Nanohaloarchaea archaeon]